MQIIFLCQKKMVILICESGSLKDFETLDTQELNGDASRVVSVSRDFFFNVLQLNLTAARLYKHFHFLQ